MVKVLLASLLPLLFCALSSFAQAVPEKDTFDTSGGRLDIYFVGHGSLFFQYQGKVIHVDPYGQLADYTKLPKADLILITHDHPDHLDPRALNAVRTDKTIVIANRTSAEKVKGAIAMNNGDVRTEFGVNIEAVPAYNLVNKRPDGRPYHPKDDGNGYVFTFGDERVYVAGDTENTPEMKALRNIDIAFLPMNLPYTMTPEMVADAAKAIKPKVLYPYHYGETDVTKLVALMKDSPDIDIRVRQMK